MGSRQRALSLLPPWRRPFRTYAPRYHDTPPLNTTSNNIPPGLLKVLQLRDNRARFARQKAFFDGLGSTQARQTTWQPHESLNNPEHVGTLTLSALVASGAHLGHHPSLMNPNFTPYAYGTRGGIIIIDLDMTLPLLRRAAALVRGVALEDGAILFVGTRPDLKKVVIKAAARLGSNGFHVAERWLPGTITNRQKVFGTDKDDLTTMRVVPDLVIFLNAAQNVTAIRECAYANIPTIGIVDSNVDPRIVMYPIPANDASPRTAEIIAGVLSIAGQEGLANRNDQIQALGKNIIEEEECEEAVRVAVDNKELPVEVYHELESRGFNLWTVKQVLREHGHDIERDLPTLKLGNIQQEFQERQKEEEEGGSAVTAQRGEEKGDTEGNIIYGENEGDELEEEEEYDEEGEEGEEEEFEEGEEEFGEEEEEFSEEPEEEEQFEEEERNPKAIKRRP